jgi:hypothetical protein
MSDELPGRPIWIELYTTDTDAAREFYTGLFGWTVQESGPEYGGYALFLRDGAPVAGLMSNHQGGPDSWTVYLESNNAEDTVAMARENGGEVIVETMEVGDLGQMAVVTDAAGAAVGVWQPGEHPGFAVRGEIGAPAWFEVLSNDYERSVPFYEAVFGWDTHPMSDTPEFRYTTLGKGDHALAGILDATTQLAGRPSHWSFYLEVDDTDATLTRARELGGSEVTAPEDSPYGRVATIADPAGVSFCVLGARQWG